MYVQITIQSLVVILFSIAMYAAFWGPADGSNFALISFWGLWWSSVMIISLLLLGRVWCYACPLGAIARFLQRFSFNLRFPTYRNKWVISGLSVLSISAITFMIARLPLYKFNFVSDPVKTGIYFLIILIFVVIVTLLFERRTFCRYICPITSAITVTSKLSPVEFVHEKGTGANCLTAEFPGNYLSGDHRCIYCMNCTADQPQPTIKMNFRWPGAAAVREKMPLLDEAIMALIIFVIFPIDHVLGKTIRGMLELKEVPDFFARSIPYFASILATILTFALINQVAARWSNINIRSSFTRFAYAYLPLGILWQVGAVIETLMKGGGKLLNGFAAGLGIMTNLPAVLATFSLIYPSFDFSNHFHVDHIFPKSLFTQRKLRNKGVAEEDIDSCILFCNSLANLQLLDAIPNMEKRDKEFKVWLNETYPAEQDNKDYKSKHYIPPIDLSFPSFLIFMDAREKLLINKLKSELNVN